MSSKSDGSEFKTDITADPSKFEQSMRQAASAAAGASDQINAQFKKIGDTVNMVNKYLLGFTAVLAGGGALKKFITDANEWNGAAGKMASQLGITTQQASVLNTALTRLGIDSDTYTTAAAKMSKQIGSNEAAFRVLGVAVKDTATGAYRPITEVMGEVNQKLAAIKNPIEQNIAGMQVYGKGWMEIRAILKLTADQMKEAEQRARELGLIVGPEGVALSRQYGAQMRDLNLVGKSLEIQFGNQLLPVFTRVGKFMSQEGPEAGQVFARIIEVVAFAASSAWLALKDMGDGLGAMAAQAVALGHLDIEGFKAIGRARDEESAKNEAAYERLKAGFGEPLNAKPLPDAPDLTKGPHYDFGKGKADKSGAADPSRMSEWEARLADTKAGIERQGLLEGQFREMSKAEELRYWSDLKGQRDLSATEKIALTRKTADVEMGMIRETFDVTVKTLQAEAERFKSNTDERLRIEREIQSKYQAGTKEYEESQKRINQIERQAIEQKRAVAQSRVEAERDAQLQMIALQEQASDEALQLGLITDQQSLARHLEFEEQRFSIARDGLTSRLKLAESDPDRNPVEVERINREIEQLEQQHQLRMGQIKKALQLDDAKGPLESFKTLEQGLVAVGTTLVTNWRQFGQQLRAMFSQIGLSMIQELIIKPAAARAVAWAKERIFAMAGIGADAAKAGAGAASAVADIPVIGPVLALAAMASVFGAVSAMSGNVPTASAAQGFDIPGTLNPITQLHAKEMVLPAKHADVIRAMADAGAGVQTSALSGLAIHIHAWDGHDVKRVLLNNPGALAAGIENAKRNFHMKRS